MSTTLIKCQRITPLQYTIAADILRSTTAKPLNWQACTRTLRILQAGLLIVTRAANSTDELRIARAACSTKSANGPVLVQSRRRSGTVTGWLISPNNLSATALRACTTKAVISPPYNRFGLGESFSIV